MGEPLPQDFFTKLKILLALSNFFATSIIMELHVSLNTNNPAFLDASMGLSVQFVPLCLKL